MFFRVQTSPDDCLQQFKFARKYQQYKEKRNLVDFDDLLILTYIHASQHQDRLKKYSWIQIDEVQDLSPFQFGIIDLFTDHSKENVTPSNPQLSSSASFLRLNVLSSLN